MEETGCREQKLYWQPYIANAGREKKNKSKTRRRIIRREKGRQSVNKVSDVGRGKANPGVLKAVCPVSVRA